MRISVITVCHNSAPTIKKTLKSLQAQSLTDIEHIIIDGASSDETLQIIRQNRLKNTTIISEPDAGIYDAMNKGLRLATGDIIAILNSDDHYADATVLERVASVMNLYDLDALYGDVEYFTADNPGKAIRRYRSSRFRPARLEWGWIPAHPALFLRRTVYEKFGHFKTDYEIAADYEFMVRIFNGADIEYRYMPEILVRMQLGGASTKSLYQSWIMNKEVIRACRENGLNTNIFKILTKYPMKLQEFIRAK